MIYEIKKYGEAVLREVAQEVENIDNEILEILDNMVETMHEAKGVGLAAPQVVKECLYVTKEMEL